MVEQWIHFFDQTIILFLFIIKCVIIKPLRSQSNSLHRHILLNTKTAITDHEIMGVDTLLLVLAYTVKQISTRIGYSVMASLIKGFRVQSHTPDPAATLFF